MRVVAAIHCPMKSIKTMIMKWTLAPLMEAKRASHCNEPSSFPDVNREINCIKSIKANVKSLRLVHFYQLVNSLEHNMCGKDTMAPSNMHALHACRSFTAHCASVAAAEMTS